MVGAIGIYGTPSASPVGIVSTNLKAYRATVASDSAVVVSTFSLTYGTRSGNFSETSMGPFSWSQNRGELTASTVGSGFVFTTEVIIDGNRTYSTTSSADLPSNSSESSGWTETTWHGRGVRNTQSLLDMAFLGFFSPGLEPSPNTMLGVLRSKETSEDKLGTHVLNGVVTRHFRSFIPFASLGVPASAAEVERVLGTKYLEVNYWTDSSNRLRLMQFGLKIKRNPETTTTTRPLVSATAPHFPITEAFQLQVSDYGTPVVVTPPPASEITSTTTCEVSADGTSC